MSSDGVKRVVEGLGLCVSLGPNVTGVGSVDLNVSMFSDLRPSDLTEATKETGINFIQLQDGSKIMMILK